MREALGWRALGYTQGEAAQRVGLTEKALERRVSRLRGRLTSQVRQLEPGGGRSAISAWSEGAMNNATTTSVNDDFDAVMEASSLGSPRVTAAMGSAPPDARQRFEHAARSHKAYIGEPQASPAQGATSRPHALGGPEHPTVRYGGRPTARVIMVSATGSGKTRTFLSRLQHTDTAATAACNEPPAHPRVSLVSRETMAAVLCAAYDVAEEAGLWCFPAPGRLTALLAARLPALAAPLPVAVEPPASMKLDIAPTDRTPTGFMESAARIHMRMLLSLSGNPDRHTDRLLLQRVRKTSATVEVSQLSTQRSQHSATPLCNRRRTRPDDGSSHAAH